MLKNYHAQYKKISLTKERQLIARAQKGSRKSRDEIVLRHLSFITFRLNIKVFSPYLQQYGEDMFSAAIPILYQKVASYDLNYKDRTGKHKPVRFSSYIWKRIDGFIVDYLRKEFLTIPLVSATKGEVKIVQPRHHL
jgi:DNA-directed RNA polymerase specialized sigma subunit